MNAKELFEITIKNPTNIDQYYPVLLDWCYQCAQRGEFRTTIHLPGYRKSQEGKIREKFKKDGFEIISLVNGFVGFFDVSWEQK